MSKFWLAGLALVGVVALVILATCGGKAPTNTIITEPKPKSDAGQSTPGQSSASAEENEPDPGQASRPQYDIITLLPRDAIPAVFDPEFLSGEEADAQYDEGELVLGVEIDGDVRAYSIPFLSGHEIVNDVVGGQPIAVTW